MVETLNQVEVRRIPTGIAGAEEKDDFIISAQALEVIKEIRIQNEVPAEYNLRLGTRSGGCSGMNYTLGFDSEMNEGDKTIALEDDLNLVIDNKSLFYLMGVTLEFIDGPQGSGFVFNNPNNSHSCGCSH